MFSQLCVYCFPNCLDSLEDSLSIFCNICVYWWNRYSEKCWETVLLKKCPCRVAFYFSRVRDSKTSFIPPFTKAPPTRIRISATFFFRIQTFPPPRVSVFKSNLPTLVPRTPLGFSILSLELCQNHPRNQRKMRRARLIPGSSPTCPSTSKRENRLGTRLPSWIQYYM